VVPSVTLKPRHPLELNRNLVINSMHGGKKDYTAAKCSELRFSEMREATVPIPTSKIESY
jgi:hypothetical protein